MMVLVTFYHLVTVKGNTMVLYEHERVYIVVRYIVKLHTYITKLRKRVIFIT